LAVRLFEPSADKWGPLWGYYWLMTDRETLLYDESDGVAWVTLNRPEALNAFNTTMQRELRELWSMLRTNDEVRCIVLTGAGDKAFSTGLDREDMEDFQNLPPGKLPGYNTPWDFDDPGKSVCPKSNDLWKPIIAAVNGMACGGAFYILGEVDFIIASDRATFFDPHVTYGMAAAFEPIFLLPKMPFQEVMRLSLLGANERISAERAHQIGFVTEVVPADELRDRASWAAQAIADQPARAVQGTLRALWTGLELSRQQALDQAFLFTHVGTDPALLAEGQERFSSGRRVEWRLR
jgi:enoyl-CoA hydratase/carnithine racemase